MDPRKKLNLRDLVGVLKDKASISKAILLSNPNKSTLNLALVRATTHEASNPPNKKEITVLLSYGHGSRNTASTCIEALMDRLHNTRSSFVAFKCLITIHYIINRGSFILQDQLSVYPAFGGRNYLNLSNFHDNSSSETWNLSFWVRWYARVLESLLITSRNLGFFLYFSVEKDEESASSLLNKDLLKELDLLATLIEEICRAPELLNARANKLVHEAMNLVAEDKCSAQKQIMIRVNEVTERIGSLNFADSVELACVLKRYKACKERIMLLNMESCVGDRLWRLIEELKEKIGERREQFGGRFVKTERRGGVSESARFVDRVVRQDDSVRYASGRLSLVRFPLPIFETNKSIQGKNDGSCRS